MGKNYAVGIISVVSIACIGYAFSHNSVPCCDLNQFFDYADKRAATWDDMQSMMITYNKGIADRPGEGDLRKLSSGKRSTAINCAWKQAFDQLRPVCSLKEWMSYRAGTTSVYQGDLAIGKPCALMNMQVMTLALPTYILACIEKVTNPE